MPLLKRVPWVSLGLLLMTHFAFGWFLREPGVMVDSNVAKFAWAFVLGFDFIIIGTMTASPNTHRARVMRWTGSNEGRLFSVILSAFFIALFLVLLRLFGYILILSLALSLARLDMLAAGFSDFPVLVVLLVVSLTGFGIGWQVNSWINPRQVRSEESRRPSILREQTIGDELPPWPETRNPGRGARPASRR